MAFLKKFRLLLDRAFLLSLLYDLVKNKPFFHGFIYSTYRVISLNALSEIAQNHFLTQKALKIKG